MKTGAKKENENMKAKNGRQKNVTTHALVS